MEKSPLTYDQATAEIEQILAKFRTDTMSVDELAAQVERATELIAHCKERLTKAEQDVKRVLES